ncbi:CRIB domain-containing protein RIC10-like [Lolium rigidum]|uniref:CRIB domain-containing protein RIC10-like n=1 Tax=Lolium rigidum TaxID=89674 RepID=UPI001F5C52C9|nr:CRIB domain-containing protein RIC10-like [Lolium rigidum]
MASSYKMKGIFKSFKIISHIFAAKEQEMEIGCPTDVKHVAHIGWNTSTGSLTGNAPASWMNSIGGSSDFGSLGNLAPSAGTSWASQDFEPRDVSPVDMASEITGQQDAAAALTCVPDVPRPPKKTRRGRKRTATSSLATSSMQNESSVSASAADTVGTSDTRCSDPDGDPDFIVQGRL